MAEEQTAPAKGGEEGGEKTPEKTGDEGKAPEEKVEKTDEDIEKIAEKAENPDAVRKALTEERESAKQARERADELAAKVKQFEDRDKSEQEKLAEKAGDAEKRASSAEAKLLRFEVAADKGVPAEHAHRLQGSTKEELEKDAEEFLGSLSATDGDDDAKRRPTERLRPGAAPTATPDESDPAKLAESVPRGY